MSSITPIQFPPMQEMSVKLSTNPDFENHKAIITPLVNQYAGNAATEEQIGMTARKLIYSAKLNVDNELELQTLRKKIVQLVCNTVKVEESASKAAKAATPILVEKKEPAAAAPALRRPDKPKAIAKTLNTISQPSRISNSYSDESKITKIKFCLKKNADKSEPTLRMTIKRANLSKNTADNIFKQSIPIISNSIKLSGCNTICFIAQKSDLKPENIKKICEAFHSYHKIRDTYSQNLNKIRPDAEGFIPVTSKHAWMQARENTNMARKNLNIAYANMKKTSKETRIGSIFYY